MKGHVARKRFGQNFLVDSGIISAIVSAINPQRGDTVVEIGPGLGAITEPLLQRVDHLHVVEIDRDLIARLQQRHAPQHLSIHAGDALAFDFASIGSDLRLIGNLPYNLSSPILFHALDHAAAIIDMHFMLQKEVVDRMAAGEGSKVYGRLSVMLQAYCRVTPLFKVPPGAFRPAPKVDSAVVRLVPKPASEITVRDHARFVAVVRAAFGQRRKTLHNALKGICDDEKIRAAGLEPQLRAEQVPVAGFIALANIEG